ncbi:MAG: 4-(cytidine 5'-diphospho)-2-C-methyl-D-erythritol kinase [Bacteroidetes bacterium]|nr:4-(cytidine 5'-diphospho)-2-C-methyl-D-erythritol kinase [Bacteroidota bacterium]
MVVFPHCKINLGLWVTGKRSDGFHDIETVFYPVKLCDILEIIKSDTDDVTFTSSGIEIPGDVAGNLCIQAYRLLTKDFSLPPVRIHLHKVIPIGSGLGGGSSDGAYTLRVLNELLKLNLSLEQLQVYARQLGSDCAFFLQDAPAYARERGDHLERVNVNLSAYTITIVKPPVHSSTAQAYAMIQPVKRKTDLKQIIARPVLEWKNTLVNDFEESMALKFPEIRTIRDKLYDAGADYASLSGSGSAVYGIFNGEPPLSLSFPGFYFWKDTQ